MQLEPKTVGCRFLLCTIISFFSRKLDPAALNMLQPFHRTTFWKQAGGGKAVFHTSNHTALLFPASSFFPPPPTQWLQTKLIKKKKKKKVLPLSCAYSPSTSSVFLLFPCTFIFCPLPIRCSPPGELGHFHSQPRFLNMPWNVTPSFPSYYRPPHLRVLQIVWPSHQPAGPG